jgi:alkylation response protein AidB-like acyl-CoA dehydrogenase
MCRSIPIQLGTATEATVSSSWSDHDASGRVTLCFGAVDFDLSPEQRDLRDAAAELLDRLATPQRVRTFVGPGATVDDGGGRGDRGEGAPARGYDGALWEAMAEQGWLGVERPEESGGLGLGMVEVAILCEELGRRVAPAPYAGTIVCLGALEQAATDDSLPSDARRAAEEWVLRMGEGEAVGCVAWSAGPGKVTARATDAGWRLTGCPEPTQYGSEADVAVVVTGEAVYALALDEGSRPSPEPAMDRTRPLAWLRLEGARAHRIGDASSAARVCDRAATTMAADMLGASARALEMSAEYAKVRRQFGHPIGSFQAIKHRLADALVDVEGMRSSTYYAAWCVASDDSEAPLAASMAKAWCSDASGRVMAAGLQVHGGIGFTWDHDLHLLLKRAQLDASSFGDAAWHRERIAGMLERRLAEGTSAF